MFKPDFFLRFITGAFTGIAFFATLYTIWVVGPPIETRFYPVVSKLQILSMKEAPGGETILMAEFKKLRACDFLGIAWFRKQDDGTFERVPVQLLRRPGDISSPNRPEGAQRSGPWIIGMPPSDIPTNSFARLSHTCHKMWTTTTDFYP